jgi:polyhydroxybutyrate depolymerase
MIAGRCLLSSLAALAIAACVVPSPERCAEQSLRAGGSVSCEVPGWTDRGYDLHLPIAWDGVTPVPAILLLHGAEGSRKTANRATCPGGDEGSPQCLVAMATAAGFAVIVPDGTGQRPVRQLRSWNAGGGGNGLACLSKVPCARKIDDLAYFDDLLAEVQAAVPLDPARIYAIGLSNGGAMSHRLACTRPAQFAAIVSVAGEDQHGEGGGACAAQVPVLDIHGIDDPIWPYAGGLSAKFPDNGVYASVDATMAGWRQRNGCAATFTDTAIPDLDPGDGTTAVRRTWDGCAQATEHIAITGGGHTWPGGYQYFGQATVGRVSRDFGNALILAFLEAHGAR